MGWVRLTDRRALNPKLRRAGLAARGLDEAVLCQIAADESDGHVTRATVEMIARAHGERRWERLVAALVEVGRWIPAGGGWDVKDYLEFNFSKAQWEAEREKKRRAGQKGGRARALAGATAGASADVTAGAPVPAPPPTTADAPPPAPPPAPADALANALANAQADPTRPDLAAAAASYDTHDPPGEPVAAAAAEAPPKILEAALGLLADRRLAAARTPIANPAGYRRAAAEAIRTDHADRIDALDLAAFDTPEALAETLEPRHNPAAANDTDAGAAQTALAARNAARADHPCPTCDATGWVETGAGMGRCHACDGAGVDLQNATAR